MTSGTYPNALLPIRSTIGLLDPPPEIAMPAISAHRHPSLRPRGYLCSPLLPTCSQHVPRPLCRGGQSDPESGCNAGLARASVWNRLPFRWVFRPNLTKHLRDEEGPLRDEYHFFSLGGGGEISRLAPKVSHPNHVTHVFVNAGGLLPFVETDRPAPSPARCQRPAPPAQRAPSLAASPGQDRAQIGRRCR